MRARHLAIFLLLTGLAYSGEPGSRFADLQPELRQALEHDDSCVKSADNPPEDSVMQSPVVTEQILSAGHAAGVIATPQDGCHCRNANCSTFVYLKAEDGLKLALQEKFASLKPMKISRHGLPSLSGKFQVSESQEETTIFDWNGAEYQPSLCATVTQRKNVRTPSIAQHPCKDTGRKPLLTGR